MEKTKILIADDDKQIRQLLALYFEKEGFAVVEAADGTEALRFYEEQKPQLLLLDVMMPGQDGLEVCRRVRRVSEVPVILLTAKGEDEDRINGLDLGADDYITKPFNPLEVIARVKTQLRRYQKYNNPPKKQFFPKSEYDIRGLIINKDTHKCFLFGKEISLTPIEFSILWYLCEHQGKVVSTEELFENIWKEKYLDNNNTVMAHIGRLREKLNEPAKNPKFIKTVWGVGYEIE